MEERYLGIFIPQLPDKGVKGWCISWIEGMVIPVFTSARKKRRGINMILTKRHKESAAVTPCARFHFHVQDEVLVRKDCQWISAWL